MIPVRFPTFDRRALAMFFSKVEVSFDGCWVWRAAAKPSGYGMFAGESAHRTSYRWFVGEIPAGHHVDHLCRHPWCVNPAHLEAVTQTENNTRAVDARARAFDAGTCRRGHDVTAPGAVKVRVTASGRVQRMCVACYRALRQSQKSNRVNHAEQFATTSS